MRWLATVALLLAAGRAEAQVFKPRGKTPVVKAVPGVLPAATAAPLAGVAETTAAKATAPQPPAAAAATPKKAPPTVTAPATKPRVTTARPATPKPKPKKGDDDDVKVTDDDE